MRRSRHDRVIREASSDIVEAVNFSGLRKSFKKLQHASFKLDKEKVDAEKNFKKALGKLPKREDGIARWLRWLADLLLHRGKPVKEFIKAAKRVQAANGRLVAFERGFIHEEGIKDREWYRHLAIAPGKWLGTWPNCLHGV